MGNPVELRADARVTSKGWVLGLFGGYTLMQSDRTSVDVLLGTRYLDLALDFDLDLSAGTRWLPVEASASQGAWDLVAGMRGRLELDGGWYLPWWVDVGTGQSDLTWQLAGGLGYAFGNTEVSLLYRHLEWNFDAGEPLDNIRFSGPMLAATWRF